MANATSNALSVRSETKVPRLAVDRRSITDRLAGRTSLVLHSGSSNGDPTSRTDSANTVIISTFKDIIQPYSAFESYMYDHFVGPVLAGFFEELVPELEAHLNEGDRLLDVGCGGGHISRLIADWRPDLEVVGLDLSPQQIARAQKAGDGYGQRLSYVVGSATALPFADGSFDALISVGSIKHWPDRLLGLSECVRVLRPGGLMIVTEADRSCQFEDMQRFVNRIAVPNLAKPLFSMFYRTYIAGQSIDVLDARELAEALDGAALSVTRTSSGGVMFSGQTCSVR